MKKFTHLSSAAARPKLRKKTAFRFKKPNLKTVNSLLAGLVILAGLGYLVQINGLATKGYQIKELEQQVASLQEVKADLELEALSLQSMDSVKDKVVGLNLVAVGQVEYLNPTPVAVAR